MTGLRECQSGWVRGFSSRLRLRQVYFKQSNFYILIETIYWWLPGHSDGCKLGVAHKMSKTNCSAKLLYHRFYPLG